MNSQRILYIQYTNPAGYPPLEHSSRLLAERDWDVWFLGTGGQGSSKLTFPHHARIRVSKMPFQHPGWRQKVHYLRYCAWVIHATLSWRPQWLYASDLWACLPALILRSVPGLRILYHEHDSPDERSRSGLMRMFLAARRQLAQRADLCVLPSEVRAQRFGAVTGADPRRVRVVWNCPLRDEISTPRQIISDNVLSVIYHGSIVADRLPKTIITALAKLPDTVRLSITGYETIGSTGYIQYLMSMAAQNNIQHRITYKGTAATRVELLERCRMGDVGLAFMPLKSLDINAQTMFSGPSNKTFDFLASGLAVLISDTPSWRAMYVDEGYGLACNPDDPASIAAALHWCFEHPTELRAMGELGRQRILSDWNYEHQFAPVLAQLEAPV